MIKFVNAKINIGLNVVARRDDGYHDLETVFYPVGIESGMPQQPEPFDDILEVNLEKGRPTGCRFQLMGRRLNCDPQKNLVVKATTMFLHSYFEKVGVEGDMGLFNIILDKHLPDGAGLGGGSADATFTLVTLNELLDEPFGQKELARMARKLGADCPFFLINTPAFAEGIGEVLSPVDIDLKGNWLLLVKPPVSVSTKEAFAGIVPKKPEFDLRFLHYLPLDQWRGRVVNDFEASIFPHHPELAEVKDTFYDRGAVYASMSGSGSAIYGIFSDGDKAKQASDDFRSTYEEVWLFKL
ncbi:MAG: 4-(cytidine 5'-diphospho)-2-C-methyl-D-erythritol kinase [Muribaculaceae bacterium]|nr:4-(cytidine 5'-diphospho)-2-C-methyl-D-erythritol kinase [Muribaculaceae bacterium]MDE6793763.1 4-(cytidine 5'-diphospho)-2-C-methyl-D-erythritol kinase [Muribaculaceae bacterium]